MGPAPPPVFGKLKARRPILDLFSLWDTSISRVCAATKINSTHKPAGEAGRYQVFLCIFFFCKKTFTILMSLCIFSFDISGPFFFSF